MQSLIKQNEAIHCKTQEEWDAVCEVLHTNHEIFTKFDNWDAHKEQSCMSKVGADIGFQTLGWYTEFRKYTITPASSFLSRNGVEVKSIEEQIRDIMEETLFGGGGALVGGIPEATTKLTALFNQNR